MVVTHSKHTYNGEIHYNDTSIIARFYKNARILTHDKAPSDGRHSSWNLEAFVCRNWHRTCFLHNKKWNSIYCSYSIGVSDKQTPLLPGDILQQSVDRAWWHYPSVIFVAGAQQVAWVRQHVSARILSTRQAYRDAWMATHGVYMWLICFSLVRICALRNLASGTCFLYWKSCHILTYIFNIYCIHSN